MQCVGNTGEMYDLCNAGRLDQRRKLQSDIGGKIRKLKMNCSHFTHMLNRFQIVEGLVTAFKDNLKTCQFEKGRSIIRFFGDLVNCHVVSPASYLNLLETLVDVTMESEVPETRTDFYVFTVLSSLPWVGRELHEKKESDLEQLLTHIENYMSRRSKPHHTALRVWYSDTPHPQEEYLECLWTQINKLKTDKWIERQILRPYIFFQTQFEEALQNNLAQIQIPPHDSSYVYPYPKVIFRLFDYTDAPEGQVMPQAHSIDRFLIEENIQFILNQYSFNRKTCAHILASLPNKQKLPLEYMIIEVILANLFALPKAPQLEIFYGSLILELCRINPQTFPIVLSHAIELLFERLDSMNVACVDRFASWFAYHLSNFQFQWSWQDWSQYVTVSDLQPKPKFIKETLTRCMRLSYYEKVQGIIPENFQTLMPTPPLPVNKYLNDDAETLPEYPIVEKLMNAFKDKATPEIVIEIINEIDNLPGVRVENGFNPLKISSFLTVLLSYASKSFTHLFYMIHKYNKVLQYLNTSEESQLCMLKTMFEIWKSHEQLMEVLVTKLLKANIISYTAIANFVFSKDMYSDLMKSYVWNILHAAIKRQILTVNDLERDLNEMRKMATKGDTTIKVQRMDVDDELIGRKDNGEEHEPESFEDRIEKLEEKYENAQSEQKNLFLTIFQRFIMLLSEHIQTCESKGRSFKNHWFRWCIGRLQQIFYEHHENIFNYVSTLESLLFTSDLDQHILLIFKQFCSLRA